MLSQMTGWCWPGGTLFSVGRSAIRFATKPLFPRWMAMRYTSMYRNFAALNRCAD